MKSIEKHKYARLEIMTETDSYIIGLLTSYMFRRVEYRADVRAVSEDYGDVLIFWLKIFFLLLIFILV